MTEQTGLAGMETEAEIEADRAAREDDPTPRSLVRAILANVLAKYATAPWHPFGSLPAGRFDPAKTDRYGGPIRVLDVCAGWGCWASEMRRLAGIQGWPIHITGVEVDHRKREHLAKWCDATIMVDWLAFFGSQLGVYAEFDLVIGNPHFSALTHDDIKQSMPAVLLRYAPHVLLFHQMASFTRSVAGRDTWRAYPPAWVGMVPGSVGFRGRKRGADLRSYQATMWSRGHTGPAALELLPEPPSRATKRGAERASSWHWDQPPGTEDPSENLPAAPGWSR